MKKVIAVMLAFVMVFSLAACGSTSDSTSSKKPSGKDYESLVIDAFWEGTCGAFGINYSDFNMLDTSTSYISDSTTSDGYTAHYYLIKTSFDTENAFGKKITHQVTARCYYVPDFSKSIYITYITLDGEKVLFDEEKEDWLLGIGGASSIPNTNTSTSSNKENNNASTSSQEIASKQTNNIDDLTSGLQRVCANYNSQDSTPLNGRIYATVNNSTSITIEHWIGDIIYSDTLPVVKKMEETICDIFDDTLNDYFPEYISIEVYSTYSYIDSTKEEAESSSSGGALGGWATSITPEEKALLEEASEFLRELS